MIGGVSAGKRRVARLDRVDERIDLARCKEAIEGVVLLIVVRRERSVRIVGREHNQRRCSLAGGLQLIDDRCDTRGQTGGVPPPTVGQIEDVRGLI